MNRLLVAALAMAITSPACAQAVRFPSHDSVTPTQDAKGCKANADMWWCYSNRKPADRQFADEVAELKRVDAGARARFTYKADPSPDDVFASHNAALESGAAWTGDCDDMALTVLDYMAWDGYEPSRMWRVGMVVRTATGKMEHMVGVVETADGQAYVVGDVNHPAYPVADFEKLYEGKAHLTYASRLDQGMSWKPARLKDR
jgi:predicted transglutaminase-like cysteine proteinase